MSNAHVHPLLAEILAAHLHTSSAGTIGAPATGRERMGREDPVVTPLSAGPPTDLPGGPCVGCGCSRSAHWTVGGSCQCDQCDLYTPTDVDAYVVDVAGATKKETNP